MLLVPWSIEIVIMDGNMSESQFNTLWLLISIRCAAGAPRSFEEAAAQSQSCEVTCLQPRYPNYRKPGAKRTPSFRRPPPGGIAHVRAFVRRQVAAPPGDSSWRRSDDRVRPLRHSKEALALTRYVSLQAACRSVLRIRFFAWRTSTDYRAGRRPFRVCSSGETNTVRKQPGVRNRITWSVIP